MSNISVADAIFQDIIKNFEVFATLTATHLFARKVIQAPPTEQNVQKCILFLMSPGECKTQEIHYKGMMQRALEEIRSQSPIIYQQLQKSAENFFHRCIIVKKTEVANSKDPNITAYTETPTLKQSPCALCQQVLTQMRASLRKNVKQIELTEKNPKTRSNY